MNPAGLRRWLAAPAVPSPWRLPLAVGLAVAALQFWFVAVAGTDLPLDDQWDLEGARLYPRWVAGELTAGELFAAHNEHRVLWTRLLDLALFAASGGWDPLLQLFAIVGLRALLAGGLTLLVARSGPRGRQLGLALGIAWLFLPHLAWHNAIWGFQSQIYFCLGFSLVALGCLGATSRTRGQWGAGVLAGGLAQFGMAPGAFVAAALGLLAIVQVIEARRLSREVAGTLLAAAVLGALALVLRVPVPEHEALRAGSVAQFARALGIALAWPYPGNAWAGILANLPFATLVLLRVTRRRTAAPGETHLLLLGFFGLTAALMQAGLRGAGEEFAFRVPSRYADFLVPIVLANGWSAMVLLGAVPGRRRRVVALGAAAWGLFLFSGWLAASAETWRGVVAPRIANLDLPVRLVRAFQATRNPEVFYGQRRLFVPHPNPESSIGRVLQEPRLKGKLPPSLQPEVPLGRLSRAARALTRHHRVVVATALCAALALLLAGIRGFSPACTCTRRL